MLSVGLEAFSLEFFFFFLEAFSPGHKLVETKGSGVPDGRFKDDRGTWGVFQAKHRRWLLVVTRWQVVSGREQIAGCK